MQCVCGSYFLEEVYHFKVPPPGETEFSHIREYDRKLYRCSACGHFKASHKYDFSNTYDSLYVSSSYGKSLKATFDRVIALPFEESDNQGRVKYVSSRLNQYLLGREPKILDVGSGLCVFLFHLKAITGWDCTAIDPDYMQTKHANEIGIRCIQSSFMSYQSSEKFNVITFNKVLEHIEEPGKFLQHSHSLLSERGLVYVEVPDGTEAFRDSPLREEFFIEHYHAFSLPSLAFLCEKNSFKILEVQRIREPSKKYTIRCFLMSNR